MLPHMGITRLYFYYYNYHYYYYYYYYYYYFYYYYYKQGWILGLRKRGRDNIYCHELLLICEHL